MPSISYGSGLRRDKGRQKGSECLAEGLVRLFVSFSEWLHAWGLVPKGREEHMLGERERKKLRACV
ncbi:hypothetical protein M419DRAFT_130642 [Trichoderma reesei RUT C-30]|uniref:Uncharacterized protein n=1 Tax=Hypocrea jecorina (strain ATCC 56765 / BCRC 32924 / NRRL 11460 / Rut C-30) TaxID=1344414 RepID=A0A024S8D8_HYPJR|nr:hypothetical protein M419DRAFT_130642 [Trichoderma reesei RUT C-30]